VSNQGRVLNVVL